ncbi:zinc metalloprotease HtpX [Thermococcus sp. GR7]|uniref:zinc metalloprotease HtpX n=1 Tax=unclassified Thermococcus TaxID=2627626 RepID=UPI0014316811|nr:MULTISPECIES: zinc metalloprotease HtpX [unclassified Thermococcus]NJE47277.1 zinc metalloprotease HtpX [Thermococcus sp. GR7]NJE78642.1 zinc metalloprotease HtpX [Thermococcus sp. GR4]NJF23233.1 zinc metalloprotease HtpX [Thermococcus sp. GR5]
MGLELWLRTGLLMAVLTGLLMAIGYLIGGTGLMFVMFMFSLVMNFISYWYSDRIVLAWYRARIVDEEEAPELYAIVRSLAERAGLPMPRVAIIPSETPNAFATGRGPKHAVVAVTTGLLRILNRDELEGVIAHELTHIKNRDILIGTIAAALAGAIVQLAYWARWIAIFGGFGRDRDEGGDVLAAILVAILAPIAAMLIQAAISRSREFLADEGGARISGKPHALASALMKIEQAVYYKPMRKGNPATAHMFIVNPFKGTSLASLFSTHPPTEKRIERLRKIAEEMGIYF